ncbi:hypothetical protein GCM10022225_29570 [Plantactinospora mayteni]|uniref:ATP/GTP-binding protein n=1 Tax=Plantactinospora mayteni TaxID=566021 RepID=A0ABQ4ESY5_9ACTN|nr:hypothetical protein [Plantactinospora mayteni]GIG97779.1 hypothetical protein Pma05_43520 [Plantactinospora mayteni]
MLTRRGFARDALAGLSRQALATGALAVLALAAGLVVTGGPAAAAPGAECPPGQGNCDVWENLPGEPGDDEGDGSGSGDGGGSGGGDRVCEKDDGTRVPCYDNVLGWFNSADDCYYKRAEPQPPDVEEGKTAYLRTCSDAGSSELVFLTDPPAGFAPPDPQQMALDLYANLVLDPPEIRTAPSDAPGLVGVPVWLHDASSWATIRKTDTEGGVTVWIEAIPTKIVWRMGNGETLECTRAGIPFKAGTHDPRRPPAEACAYAGYPRASSTKPGGRYEITAVKHWTVPWGSSTGEGDEDALSTSREATTSIRIDELQVVTR